MYLVVLSFIILFFLFMFIGSSQSFTLVKTKHYYITNPYTTPNDVIEKGPEYMENIPKNTKPEQNMKQEHTPEPEINPIQQSQNTIPSEYIVKPKYFKVI